MSENDGFAQEFYWAMRNAVTGRLGRDAKRIKENKKRGGSKPFDKGRDPNSVGDTLGSLIKDFKWTTELGQAEVFANWSQIVGEATAAKTTPESLLDGELPVRCASTAWATQLKLMQTTILSELQTQFPELEIETLKLLGPAGPNFKRGLRSVPGRGPRDTWG